MDSKAIIKIITTVITVGALIYLGFILIIPLFKESAYFGCAVVFFFLWCVWGFLKKF
jgi:apolipoprotein N-acyltransferase